MRAKGEPYIEINLSPSSEWAVYTFEDYRQGMRPAVLAPPRIEVEEGPDRFELRTELDLGALLPPSPWKVGLTAVIETDEGLSYWALAHPPGRPDFHHPDCFALELAATGRP